VAYDITQQEEWVWSCKGYVQGEFDWVRSRTGPAQLGFAWHDDTLPFDWYPVGREWEVGWVWQRNGVSSVLGERGSPGSCGRKETRKVHTLNPKVGRAVPT